MKKRILIFPMILLLALGACGKKETDVKSMERYHSELGVPVRVKPATKTVFEQVLRYNASLGGSQESTAQAMVSDVVSEIRYKVGDTVQKGDIVVVFPRNTPAAQYEQANSAFQSISQVHDRMQRLYQQSAISLQDYENVQTQYLVAKANLEASEQMVFVKAPMSGIITNIMVQVSEKSYPGQNLFTVTASQGYKATLLLPESEISKINKGSKATAKWENYSIQGRVSSIAMALDTQRNAFRVEADFGGRNPNIPYGVTAEIELEVQRKPDVFVVQRQHLVRENGNFYLWLAEGDTAKRQQVEIGLNNQMEYEIVSGLSEADIVITEGIKSLSEGAKIRIIEGS
ncbi:MAG: efflux RND transporter periplasmic adaptor subunit [Candidatus Cloacimonetes bacterium]|nr:efflux RND transporter periplasmic adaptor subunit [Candidatus Cloacimonadota bacterium]